MFVTLIYKFGRLCQSVGLALVLVAMVAPSVFAEGGHDQIDNPRDVDVPIERAPLPDLRDKAAPGDHTPGEGGLNKSYKKPHGSATHELVTTSNTLRRALKAYRAKRIKEAIVGLEQAAERKSFIARFLLAHIYRTGKGGVINHRLAYDYYQQITAEFADADIQNIRHAPYVAHAFVQLARYVEGGVKELDIQANPVLARILYEKAAHFGDLEGQYQLGRFLIESGKQRNVKLGQRWLTRAAMKNNAKAQAYLGALYLSLIHI